MPVSLKHILVPGLAAGLIINVSEFILNMMVVGKQMMAAMQRMNLPMFGTDAMVTFVVLGFLLGIAIAWLYAAVRPRFGPGPRTATIVAVVVWFLAYLYAGIGMAMMGMYPMAMEITGLAWGLVEVIVAANVAGMLYKGD